MTLQIFRRIRNLVTSQRRDREMDEEMAIHLAMEADHFVRGGLDPAEAMRRAHTTFGGVQRFREEGRDARGIGPWRDLGGDIRYGLRALRHAPVFATIAIGTLALGIGANTAIFSVVNGVILKPLPFSDTESLVSVWNGVHTSAEFTYVRDRTRTLEQVASYVPDHAVVGGDDGEPVRLAAAIVSASFFDVLRVKPARGRLFESGDDTPSAEPVVVVSHALWRSRYGSDPGLLGSFIDVEGVRRRVVGIAPAGLTFPSSETRFWIPQTFDPTGSRCRAGGSNAACRSSALGQFWGISGQVIIGRLKGGVTLEQAREDLRRVATELQAENPVWRPAMPEYLNGVNVIGLQDRIVSDSRRLLLVLLGAVGLVLLLACANVANLLVVRGAARAGEISVRAALGAGPARIARQLTIENLLLAVIGGVAGVVVAAAGIPILVRLLSGSVPRLDEVHLDRWVLLFTFIAALVTGLVFGVLPARRLSRTSALGAMSGPRAGLARSQRRLASLLVSGQVAIGVMLAIGAGLLVRSLGRILDVDPGFETTQVVSARVNPPRARFGGGGGGSQRDLALRRQFGNDILEKLASSPGVTTAAITTQLPFDKVPYGMAIWIDGWTTDPNRLEMFELRAVSPEFFRTLGIPITKGRSFTDTDCGDCTPVAIVSEGAARRFWPDREALGGQVRYPWPGWMTVVGIAANVHNNDLRSDALPAIYVPFDQGANVPFSIVVRSPLDASSVIATIRAAVSEVSDDTPLSHEKTMEALVQESVAAPKAAALLLLSFGGLALLLGAVGTYGLVAYGVETRRREFAVRMAVGARPGSVIALVLREATRFTVPGVLVGLGGALALAGVLRGLLYEVAPTDPLTFTVAPLVLGVTALVACLGPAWRAARIAPNGALRE